MPAEKTPSASGPRELPRAEDPDHTTGVLATFAVRDGRLTSRVGGLHHCYEWREAA